MKILNRHDNNTSIFAFYIFGIKCCLHPYIYVLLKLPKKTTYPQKLFDYDCVTLYMASFRALSDSEEEISEGDDNLNVFRVFKMFKEFFL